MRRRSALARFLTLLWATAQLAAPAFAGIADGRASAESASGPTTHVEATTTERCLVVHSPDCGLCRYVSGSSAPDAAGPSIDWDAGADAPRAESFLPGACGDALALPFGRAPPTV